MQGRGGKTLTAEDECGEQETHSVDIERFHREVLSRGAEACLPRNLSNEWLEELLFEAGSKGVYGYTRPGMPVARLLATLIVVLGKGRAIEGVRGYEALLSDYYAEICFEIIARSTPFAYEAATLDTIFSRTDVRFQRDNSKRG
jgi:hypothetical protein